MCVSQGVQDSRMFWPGKLMPIIMRQKDHSLLLASRETGSRPEVARSLSATMVPETASHTGRRSSCNWGARGPLTLGMLFIFSLGGPSATLAHWI